MCVGKGGGNFLERGKSWLLCFQREQTLKHLLRGVEGRINPKKFWRILFLKITPSPLPHWKFLHSTDSKVRDSEEESEHIEKMINLKCRRCIWDEQKNTIVILPPFPPAIISWCTNRARWTEAEFLSEIQAKVLRSFPPCYSVASTDLPWDFYFFKLTQPHAVSYCTL